MSHATLVMQEKLYALGYQTPRSGFVHKTDFSDVSRTAIQTFKARNGLYNSGHIDADFLKTLDKKYYASNSNSKLPASYYKGWNLDIGFTTERQSLETPDSPSNYNNGVPSNKNENIFVSPDGEIIVVPDENKKPFGLVMIAILAGAGFYFLNKKKKRR